MLAPAFVDPHVHLRTPGREDEETIALRHGGGRGRRLLRDPRDAEHRAGRRLGGGARRARRAGARRGGRAGRASWPRSRKGQQGDELTEMAELADAGRRRRSPTTAGRSSPPGSCGARSSTAPSPSCGSRSTARSRRSRAAATCTRARSRPSSASAGYPSIAESVMVERDLALAAYEGRPLHLHAPLGARVGRGARRRARARASRATAEVTPHHLVPHRRGRPLARPEREDEPAAARRRTTARRCVDALRDGTISCVATDHAPHARHEKDVPFEEAPFGVTGLETAFAALYTHLVEPGIAVARDAARAHVRRAGARVRPRRAADRGRRAREPRRCSTSQPSGR